MGKHFTLKGPRVSSTDRIVIHGVIHKWCAHQQHWVPVERGFNNSSQTKDGLRSYCRDCDSIRYHLKKDDHRFGSIRRRYGITKDQYLDMIEEQNDRCPICEKTLPTETKHIHIDHDHKTGNIRGILCASCNTTLGRFNDDVVILQNAIDYLEEHRDRDS